MIVIFMKVNLNKKIGTNLLKFTFMKAKYFSIIVSFLALGISLFVSSCEKPEEKSDPKLILKADKIEVEAAGGNASIEYTLENPVAGMEIVPEYSAEWLSDFNTSETGRISFSVASNSNPDSREADVLFKYGKLSASLKVLQKGLENKPDPDAQIVLEITQIDVQHIVYNAIPKDKEQTYIAMVVEQSYMDQFKSDEEYFEDDLKFFNMSAEMRGMSLEEFLQEALYVGDMRDLKIENLKPERNYCLYAYGINTKGEMTTDKIDKVKFTTKPVEKVDITFDIQCEVDGPELTMTVKPSDKEQGYYFDAISKENLAESGVGIDDLVQKVIDEQISFGLIFGQTIEDILAEMLSYGDASHSEFALMAETDYIAFALAVNERGLVCSDTGEKEFRTGSVDPSDNQITLSLSNAGIDAVDYSITTTNDDSYVFVIDYADNWRGMSDDEVLKKLLSEYDLSYNVRSGNEEGTIDQLDPDTEYYAWVFGYYAGVATTAISSDSFKTLEAGNPADLTFTFDIPEMTDTSVTISATGTPDNATFYVDMIEASATKEEILAGIEEEIEFYLEYGYILSRKDYWKGELDRGTVSYQYTGLTKGDEYKAYAFGVYAETGEIATDVYMSDSFVIGEGGSSSSASVKLISDKHFDIIELAEVYPDDYADYAFEGYCVYPVKVEAAGDIKYTYMATLFEDAMSMTDAQIIENLATSGSMEKEIHFMLPYDTEITVVAVGEDVRGEYTKVEKKLICLTKETASPVGEYVPKGENTNASSYISPRKAERDERLKSVRNNTISKSVPVTLSKDKQIRKLGTRKIDFSKKNAQVKEKPVSSERFMVK